MGRTIDLVTHPKFTIDEFVAITGWEPSLVKVPRYKENMRLALDYFQGVVPQEVLRAPIAAPPWGFTIGGRATNLTGWMQGIDFHHSVNPHRSVKGGHRLIAFKDATIPYRAVRGSWYAFPYTWQDNVAIHSSQQSPHCFKAKFTFTCMQSQASDAHVTWFDKLPAEYRHGGAQQLFVWNAHHFLEPVYDA